jgi:hypothetical protein
MSISKRAFGVEGYRSDSRPYPTLDFIKKHVPKEIENFKFIDVQDTKPTFTFTYYNNYNSLYLEFQIKMIRIDEWPRQANTLINYIKKILLDN